MRGPKAHRGNSDEGVLPWLERPRADHLEGDTACVPGEELQLSFGAAATYVTVNEEGQSGEAFQRPEDDDGEKVVLRVSSFDVFPEEGDGEDDESDVQM